MTYIIMAQLFSLAGLILSVYSTQQEAKNKIMLFNSLSNAACCIQYLLLGALTGAISSIIATSRNIIFKRFNDKVPIYILLIYYIVTLLLNYNAFNGIISFIPVFNIMLYGYGIWQNDIKFLKIIIIIVSVTGFIYDIVNLAFVSCFSQSITLTAAVVGYIKTIKLNEKCQA